MKMILTVLYASAALSLAGAAAQAEDLNWQPLPGVTGVQYATAQAGRLMIIKADPKQAPLALINASQTGFEGTIRATAERENLAVATNAAMFKEESKSIGYMRNFGHVNQTKFRKNLKGILAFNPKRKSSPAVKVIIKEGAWEKEIAKYETVFESYRMIARGPDGRWESKWNQGASVYHDVALAGVDADDQLLLFFHGETIDMYDLNNIILALPLELKGLIYLDGGFHGGLYLHPDTGVSANDGFIPVPNVLGLKARP